MYVLEYTLCDNKKKKKEYTLCIIPTLIEPYIGYIACPGLAPVSVLSSTLCTSSPRSYSHVSIIPLTYEQQHDAKPLGSLVRDCYANYSTDVLQQPDYIHRRAHLTRLVLMINGRCSRLCG